MKVDEGGGQGEGGSEIEGGGEGGGGERTVGKGMESERIRM